MLQLCRPNQTPLLRFVEDKLEDKSYIVYNKVYNILTRHSVVDLLYASGDLFIMDLLYMFWTSCTLSICRDFLYDLLYQTKSTIIKESGLRTSVYAEIFYTRPLNVTQRRTCMQRMHDRARRSTCDARHE